MIAINEILYRIDLQAIAKSGGIMQQPKFKNQYCHWITDRTETHMQDAIIEAVHSHVHAACGS
jgi:hypothetical protein